MTSMLVINMNSNEPYNIYIGRGEYSTDWSNPYVIGEYYRDQLITRSLSIQLYEIYLRNRLDVEPELLEKLMNLPSDTVFACWCAPEPCHGDIIIKLYEELVNI